MKLLFWKVTATYSEPEATFYFLV